MRLASRPHNLQITGIWDLPFGKGKRWVKAGPMALLVGGWQINNLLFPLDAQLLGEDRVLVAEYHGNRVTERDLKGAIIWSKQMNSNPHNVQRLPNGHTLIATNISVVEVDRTIICSPSGEMSAAVSHDETVGNSVTNSSVVVPLVDCGYAARYTRFGSRNSTGSSPRIAEMSSPFASIGLEGQMI